MHNMLCVNLLCVMIVCNEANNVIHNGVCIMKVTQKAINSFNRGNKPLFNENANKVKGFHSCAEHVLFSAVQWSDSGCLYRPISLKKVKDYLEIKGM